MSYPKTREVYKITVPAFHALEPLLDPDPRHELLDGQISVLPIPWNWHTIALMELDGQLLRQERPGLHVWRGGLILNDVSEPWPDLTLPSTEPLPSPDNPAGPEGRLVVEVAYPTADFETGPRPGRTKPPQSPSTGSWTSKGAASCATFCPTTGAKPLPRALWVPRRTRTSSSTWETCLRASKVGEPTQTVPVHAESTRTRSGRRRTPWPGRA